MNDPSGAELLPRTNDLLTVLVRASRGETMRRACGSQEAAALRAHRRRCFSEGSFREARDI